MTKRIRCFDVIRGFSVVSMILFHFCYDLRFIYNFDLPWFRPPLQDIWRASISWTFLLVAGCMCSLSHDNLRRAGKYGLVAFAIFSVTSLAGVDDPISFGIIFCMSGSTFAAWLLDRINLRPRGYVGAVLLFVLFLLTLRLPEGIIGIGPFALHIPAQCYQLPWFAWLGFPSPGFISSDYYPLLPFTLLFLCGSALGSTWHESSYPSWLTAIHFRPLEWLGRHALPCYVLHQPILLALSSVIVGRLP